MSAIGYKRTCGEVRQRVRFTPKSGHSWGGYLNTETILYVTNLPLCGLLYGNDRPGGGDVKAGSQHRSKLADREGEKLWLRKRTAMRSWD